MYLIMDLVVNHCSDKHEWFQKALADPDGPYADYFISGRERMEIHRAITVLISGETAGSRYRIGQILFPYVRKGAAGFKLGKSKTEGRNLPDDQLVAGQRTGRFSD